MESSTNNTSAVPAPAQAQYVKTEEGIYLNTSFIRWMTNRNRCFYICNRKEGCYQPPFKSDKHIVCQNTSPQSYKVLLGLAESSAKE